MQPALDQLVTRLRKAHGEQLVSVVLIGSAAAGENDRKFSDINVLYVLQTAGSTDLQNAEPVFRWWQNAGHPPPLLFSHEELKSSTDCFAIEFHDMKQSHRILYGEDVVGPLAVENSFYRAQVERELRSKLLRLRTKAASALSEKEALAGLLVGSVSTFCVLFRHALLLHGVEVGLPKREIIDRCQSYFGLDPTPFHQLLDVREEKTSLSKLNSTALLSAYLRECSIVINAVERLTK